MPFPGTITASPQRGAGEDLPGLICHYYNGLPAMPQADHLQQIRDTLSTHRLHLGFRAAAGEPDSVILARALYNVALCEALYPVLHHLEVALRNSLDAVIGANYPASTAGASGPDGLPLAGSWLDAIPGVLGRWERVEIQSIKTKLGAAGKTVTPHRLIAGLSLGFWAGLFTRAYEMGPDSSYVPGAARRTALWPRHLRAVLPYLPRRFATRNHAYRTFKALADLRNQVFHHRPVWRLPLNALHVSTTEAIGWMSPDLKELTTAIDRFPRVFMGGLPPYEQQLAVFLANRAT